MNAFIYLIGIIAAAVFGFWLRKAASDEIRVGKKWFKALIILSLIIMGVFIYYQEAAAALTCAAIAVIAIISLK